MKLPSFSDHASRRTARASRPRGREQGIAVIVVLALVFLVLIYLLGNVRTFTSLGGELKLLERQQTRRLHKQEVFSLQSSALTNAPAGLVPQPKAER
jgi:hypothetical protein